MHTITILRELSIAPEKLKRSKDYWPCDRNAKCLQRGDVIHVEDGRTVTCLINSGFAVKGNVPLSQLPDSQPLAPMFREKSAYETPPISLKS